jgi:hypothetical protein
MCALEEKIISVEFVGWLDEGLIEVGVEVGSGLDVFVPD